MADEKPFSEQDKDLWEQYNGITVNGTHYTPSQVTNDEGLRSVAQGKTNTIYESVNGGFTSIPRLAVTKTNITLDTDTGEIKVSAPDSILNSSFYKESLKPQLMELSQGYKLNPDYKFNYTHYNEDGSTEEKETNIPDYVNKLNEGLESYADTVNRARANLSSYANTYGDKAYNLSDEQIVMSLDFNNGKTVPIPDYLLRDPKFSALKDKVANGRVTLDDLATVYNRDKLGRQEMAEILGSLETRLKYADWGSDWYEGKNGEQIYNENGANEAAKSLAFREYVLANNPKSEWWQAVGDNVVSTAMNALYGANQVFLGIASDVEAAVTLGNSKLVHNEVKEMNTAFEQWNAENSLVNDATDWLSQIGYLGGMVAGTVMTAKVGGAVARDVSGAIGKTALQGAVSALGEDSAAASALTTETMMAAAYNAKNGLKAADNLSRGARFLMKIAPLTEKVGWATSIATDVKVIMSQHKVLSAALGTPVAIMIDTIHDALLYNSADLRDVLEASDQETRDYWMGQLVDNAKWWLGWNVIKGTLKGSRWVVKGAGKAATQGRLGTVGLVGAKYANKAIAGVGDMKMKLKDKMAGGDFIQKLQTKIDDAKGRKKDRLQTKKEITEWNSILRSARREFGNTEIDWDGVKVSDESVKKLIENASAVRAAENAVDRYRYGVQEIRSEMIGAVKNPATGKLTYINPTLAAANIKATDYYMGLSDLTKKYNLPLAKDSFISQNMIDYEGTLYDIRRYSVIANGNGQNASSAADAVEKLNNNLRPLEEQLPDEIKDYIRNNYHEAYTDFYSELNQYGISKNILNENKINSYMSTKEWQEIGYMPSVKQQVENGKQIIDTDGKIASVIEQDFDSLTYAVQEGQHYVDPELVRQSRINKMAAAQVNAEMLNAYTANTGAAFTTVIGGETTDYVERVMKGTKALEKSIDSYTREFADYFEIREPQGKVVPYSSRVVAIGDREEAISTFTLSETKQILTDAGVLPGVGENSLCQGVTEENFDDWYNMLNKRAKNFMDSKFSDYGSGDEAVTDLPQYKKVEGDTGTKSEKQLYYEEALKTAEEYAKTPKGKADGKKAVDFYKKKLDEETAKNRKKFLQKQLLGGELEGKDYFEAQKYVQSGNRYKTYEARELYRGGAGEDSGGDVTFFTTEDWYAETYNDKQVKNSKPLNTFVYNTQNAYNQDLAVALSDAVNRSDSYAKATGKEQVKIDEMLAAFDEGPRAFSKAIYGGNTKAQGVGKEVKIPEPILEGFERLGIDAVEIPGYAFPSHIETGIGGTGIGHQTEVIVFRKTGWLPKGETPVEPATEPRISKFSALQDIIQREGDDFELGLQQAYLTGDKDFAKSPLLKQAMKNLEDGKEAFYQGVTREQALSSLRKIVGNKVNLNEIVDDLYASFETSIDDFVATLLDDGGAKAALDALSESANAPEQSAKYLALKALRDDGGDNVARSLDKALRETTNKLGLEEPNAIKFRKKVKELFDDYLDDQIDDAANAVKSGGGQVVDPEEIFDEVSKLNKDILALEKEVRSPVEDSTRIMFLDQQGRQAFAQVDPAFAALYNRRYIMEGGDANWMAQWNAAMSKVFRYGTTTVNFSSFGNQLFRDFGNALYVGGGWQTIKSAADDMQHVWGENIVAQIKAFDPSGYEARQIEAFASANGLTTEEAAALRELSKGAARAPSSTERQVYKDLWKKLKKQNDTKLVQMKTSLQDALDKINPDDILNGKRENYLRNRVYANGYTQALQQGYTVQQAREFATFAMNNATTNFSRQVYHLQAIAESTPYFAAGINGSKSFWRMWSMDPIGVSSRITGGLLLPTVALVGMSLADPENRAIYEKLPEYQKEDNLVFVINKQVMSIPIPQEISTLITPLRQITEYLYGANKNDFWELMMNDALGFVPYEMTGFSTIDMDRMLGDPNLGDRLNRGFAKMFSQMAPVPVKTAYMLVTHTDPYTGKRLQDNSYWYWNEQTGQTELMDYTQNEFAKLLGDAGLLGADATVWQKVLTGLFGQTTTNVLDDITTIFTKGWKEAGRTTGENLTSQISKPFHVDVYDPADGAWRRAVKELTVEKEAILSDDKVKTLLTKLQQTSDLDERKKIQAELQNYTDEFHQKVVTMVKRLDSEYGGSLDRYKLGAVVQLLNFNTDPSWQTGNQYSSDTAQAEFYDGRTAAYQMMTQMGIRGSEDLSMLGYSIIDKETGLPAIKYSMPTAILDYKYTDMAQTDINLANIKAIVSDAKLWDKHESVKQQMDKLYSAKDYTKYEAAQINWNAEVAKTIAPYISQMTPEAALNNTQVLNYLYPLIEVPYSWEKNDKGKSVSLGSRGNKKKAYYDSWIKSMFNVNDKYKGQY